MGPLGADSLPEPPGDDGDQGDGGEIVFDVAIVSCGDASPILEAAEGALDDASLFVDALVVGELHPAVTHGGNDGGGATLVEPITQNVGVIALVGGEMERGWQCSDALLGNGDIRDISRRYDDRPGSAMPVADDVDLGLQAVLGLADTMGQAPPFPPPARRWALTRVASMKSWAGVSSSATRA